MPRFILLEHVGAPDDPAGLHYDLLLEAREACHTWQLAEIPSPGGPAVAAVEITPHRLAWLDHVAGKVSGGRGFARRIDGGTYEPALEGSADGSLRERIDVRLVGDTSTPKKVPATKSGDDGQRAPRALPRFGGWHLFP